MKTFFDASPKTNSIIMKPTRANSVPMKTTRTRKSARILAGSIAALLAVQSAHAATIYWDGTGTGWDAVASWDTLVDGSGGDPGAIPGSADVANFSINSVNSAQTVNLNANQLAAGLIFLGTNTATTALLGGGTNRTLTLGTSGIVVNSLAGAVTIGSSTAGENVAITLNGAQSWTNNSMNTLTIENAVTNGAQNLTVSGTGNTEIKGAIGGGAGQLLKAGTGLLTLSGANTYTGAVSVTGGTMLVTGTNAWTSATNINAGTLQFSGATGANNVTSAYTLVNGGSLIVNNTTAAGGNNNARIGDGSTFAFNGGSFAYMGADAAATNSTETIQNLSGVGNSTITVTFGGTNVATLTAGTFTHAAGNATNLVNGVNLGMDSTSTASLARFFSAAPTLVGTTAAINAGINSAVKNTQIVPFLVGEATSTTGGLGTATGTANTFVTYVAGTGYRPLNLTDEFTSNAITAGNNTSITSATVAATASINSLIIGGGGDLTITDGQTLTNASGAILFSGSSAINPSSSTGALALAAVEGQFTVNSTITGTISAVISGTAGLTKSGAGTLVLSGSAANSYTGTTTVNVGTLQLGKSGAVQAITGALTIGSTSSTAAPVVQYTGASTNMMGTGAVAINSAGQLDFNGKTDTIGAVTINATGATGNTTNIANTAGLGNLTIGTLAMTPLAGFTSRIDTGTGTLTLGGNVTFTAATTGQARISGNLALGATRTFTVGAGTGAGYDLLIDAAISGSTFGLTKDGAGVLMLQGANNFTGVITIGSAASAGGTIRSGAANVLPNFGITMMGGTIDLNGNNDTVGSGSGSAIYYGATNGPLSAGRTSTITTGAGTLTLAGTIVADSNAKQQMIISGKLDLGAATRDIQNHTYSPTPGHGAEGVSIRIQADISGTGVGVNLIKGNDGNAKFGATFSGTNTYNGTTSINNSRLQLGEGGLTGSLNTASNITSANDATLIFNRSNTVTQGTDFDGALDGVLKVTQAGSGILILNGANTYSGVTTVNAGTLQLAGVGATTVIANGGLTINAGALAQYTGASTNMMGTGTVTVNSTGQFDFNGKTDTIGAITIVATGATGNTTPVINTAGGGNMNANGLNFTPVAGFTSQINTGTGTLTLANNVNFTAATTGQARISGNLALGTAARTFTIALGTGTNHDLLVDAIISSGAGGGIGKAGAGRLALSANSTYLGATSVSAGTLILSGDNTAATGDIGVTGGVVQFDTTDSINGGAYNVLNRDVTVTSPGAVVFGSSFGAGNIPDALANRIVASSTGAIAADNYGGTNFDFNTAGLTAAALGAVGNVTYTGTLTPNGTTYRLGGGGGTLTMGSAMTGGNSVIISGNVNLADANTYTGSTTLTSGIANLAIAENVGVSGPLGNPTTPAGSIIFGGGTLQYSAVNQFDYSSRITGTGNNAYKIDTNGQNVTFATGLPASGTSGLTKSGLGTLTLGGANTYSGPTTVSAGVLKLNHALAAQNSTITVAVANGLTFGTGLTPFTIGGLSGSTNLQLLDTGSTAIELKVGNNNAATTYSGALSGTGGSLTKIGTGTLTLTSGSSTYTNPTKITQGVISTSTPLANIGSAGFLGAGDATSNATNAASLILDGGTLQFVGGGTPSISNRLFTITGGTTTSAIDHSFANRVEFTSTGSIAISGTNTSQTFTLSAGGTNNGNNYFAPIIPDNGTGKTSIVKAGGGSWNLRSANTFSGDTLVSGGTLITTNSLALQNSAIDTSGAGVIAMSGGNIAPVVVVTTPTFGGLKGSKNLALVITTAYTGVTALTLKPVAGAGYYYSGGIANGAAGMILTKTGAGHQTLAGANTYTGATLVNVGTLNVTGSLTSAVTVAAAAILSGQNGTTSSTLALNAGSTIVGVPQVDGAGNAFRATDAVTAPGGAASVLVSGSDGSATVGVHNLDVVGYGITPGAANFSTANYRAGAVADTGATDNKITLTYTNAARTWDSAASTWDILSTMAWQEGDFLFGQGDAVTLDDTGTGGGGVRTVTLNTLATPGGVSFNNATSTYIVSGTGGIGGATGLTKTGGGTATLSTNNSYTGVTTLGAGVLSVATIGDGGAAGNLGQATTDAGNLVFDGGTLQYTGATASTNRNFTINSASTATFDVSTGTNTLTVSGASTATDGALTKTGAGTLLLSGANLYTGATTVNGGILKAGASNAFGNDAEVTLANNSGAALNITGFNTQIGSLTGGGLTGGNVTLGAATLTVAGSTSPAAYAGVISGTGALTKSGVGTLTLSGANTYAGATTITAGTLAAGFDTALGVTGPSGAILKFDGGTFQPTGAITSSRPVVVAAGGGTFDTNGFNSTFSGPTSGAGTLTKTGAGDLSLTGTSGSLTGQVDVTAGKLITNATVLAAPVVLSNSANVTFDQGTAGTYAKSISGTGSLTKQSAGVLTVSAVSTYDGPTFITGGTLRLAGAAPVSLIHRWSFNDGTANDSVGMANGTLFGNTTPAITGGQLILNLGSDQNQYMKTSALPETLGARTIVGWVSLSNLSQPGGAGVLGIHPAGVDNFDSIVYQERTSGQWMNGSSGFARSPENNGGAAETSTGAVMIALTYETDNSIKIYRNGFRYDTSATQGSLVTRTNPIAIIGRRFEGASPSLQGAVDEARIYNTPLSAMEIGNLYTAGPNGFGAGSDRLPIGTTVTMSTGTTFDINGAIQQIGAMQDEGGTGTRPVILGGGTLKIGNATNAETVFSGAISGAGAVEKNGTSIQTLHGAQQYDSLTVTEGTLNVNGEVGTIPANGTASVVVAAGAKLKFGSVSQTLTSLTIGAGATVTFTSGAASGAFIGGGGGKTASLGGSAVVPEPGTLGLLLIGALGMLNRRRRQNCSWG